ncbi:hypothetical protein BJX63DRAFT_437954 [Aspergillus granulosus]|uniref:Uncharacterized protein n=1 Tax=Aspergillus granulosus TaxID=176169 RepID=A0ABR4GV26_9EURO
MLQPAYPEERPALPVRNQQPHSYEYLSVGHEWLYGSTASSEIPPAASSAHNTTVPSLSATPELDPQARTEDFHSQPGVWFDRLLPKGRCSLLSGLTPVRDGILTNRAMYFMLRVLKSWPRMMAIHGPDLLPPFIHKFQLANGIPEPLAICFTLVNIWSAGMESNPELVCESIVKEIRRLLYEYPTYNTSDLLAALQSLLILLIILVFCMVNGPCVESPMDPHILIEVWEVKTRLAATGLFLDPTTPHGLLSWSDWSLVSAKQRTIHGLYHFHYAWSLLRGYPTPLYGELGPLPAPPPRYLWEVSDEETWKRMYARFMQQWKDGPYLMSEMFSLNCNAPLEPRAERWLAEADEFGMMLMAEGTIILPECVPEGVIP